MIREEDHFVWNFTFLMGFLAVGFSVGMVFGLLIPDNPLGAAGGVFVHLGIGHILGNIVMIFFIGLALSAFAHPFEFASLLVSAVLVHVAVSAVWFSVVGLSLVVYVSVAALFVYLGAVVFEFTRFSRGGQIAISIAALLLATLVYLWVASQLQHDFAVVFEGQPVQDSRDWYTRESSLAHVVGFFWGLVAAVGLRIARYRLLDIEHSTVFSL